MNGTYTITPIVTILLFLTHGFTARLRPAPYVPPFQPCATRSFLMRAMIAVLNVDFRLKFSFGAQDQRWYSMRKRGRGCRQEHCCVYGRPTISTVNQRLKKLRLTEGPSIDGQTPRGVG
ncbi:hypothetical protein BDQ17DRAFT_462322 [Cyathus striatus]|nr:hypothetical protein BDQ17DRAFT_462322 [Cyathus striatus]